MVSHAQRRQILLFLAAIILPCSLLVVLTLRMIRQERELAEKRLVDERARVISHIRQTLLARLERIKSQAISSLVTRGAETGIGQYEHPAVELVARVAHNGLVLPWEANLTVERSRQALSEGDFARRMQHAEHEEFVRKDLAKATRLYRELTYPTRYPVQVGYARLSLARALAKLGQWGDAIAQYRRILALPSNVTDEHGVPVSLYAAARLLDANAAQQSVVESVRREATAPCCPPVAEAYMLRDLVKRLPDASADLEPTIAQRIRYLEQAVALQRDFPSLGLGRAASNQSRTTDSPWVLYGADRWFVSMAPATGTLPAAVVAVSAQDVFAALDEAAASSNSVAGQMQFLAGNEPGGELVGPEFPGLRVRFLAHDAAGIATRSNVQRPFYVVTLLLVLSVTLFGAYLLWRDVRRELRLAEMRSHFVSSVSHELKTPLTAIRMFAETLQMGRSTEPEMHAEYLQTIVNESERLTRLLNNVLDLSKIEQRQKVYRFEPASLEAIVQRAARTMQYPLAQQGFELQVETENGLPPVSVDPDALEQAILNLLTNAMKYSGESRDIDLRLRRQYGHAVIEVTDRGVGIPPKEQARIVEKFYRAPTPENQRIPGTGLGLTIVDHIVKAHGGHLEVQSVLGAGSTVGIHLPLEGDL